MSTPADDRAARPAGGLSGAKQALLDRILAGRIAGGAGSVAAIPRRPPGAPTPLSFAQERLWFLHQMERGSPAYNIPAALRLTGALDRDALRRALDEAVRRHEALRTTFAAPDGAPVQVVHPPAPLPLPVRDLEPLPAVAREAEARRLAHQEAVRPFDLEAGPLFRAELLRLDEQEHVLLLCMHHVVSDGWSMGVLFRELSALYTAFARGEPSPLPELPFQYADYALWQREELRGERLDAQLAYWTRRLAGAPALLELPTDRPRPPVQSYRGAAHRLEVPAETTARLNALARQEGTTLYMVLLAAWQALLGRYAGQDDVVVGSPIAGRTRPELEELVGFFANTVVLRTDLSGDPTFAELLRRVRETTLDAYQHQDLPLERLVEVLHPQRSLAHHPVFQVIFALQNAPQAPLSLPGLVSESIRVEGGTAKFDLVFTLAEVAGGLVGHLGYAAELFEPATIERMAGHYRVLLQEIAAAPGRRLSDISLLDAQEREQVLVEWNDTAAPLPQACVHELFAAQAQRTPSAVAVSFEGERVTYADLDARANQLAHHLRARGVGPEVRVGILLERGPELIVSLLAVLKAGGAYVPLDPRYPAERLVYMLADSGVHLLLTHTALSASVPEGAEPVWLDAEREEIAAADTRAPEAEVSPDNLAYVIYTSGSTGRPKGVAVTHRAIVRLLFGTDYVRFGPDEVLSEIAPVSFDASTFEIWGALLHGGRLAVFPPYTPSVAELEAFFRDAGVTTAWMPTGLFHAVVDEHPAAFAPLRQVISGGEVTSPAHVRRVVERYPGLRFVHAYGPTESTTYTTCRDVTLDDLAGGPISLGGPIANTRLYVLDAFFGAMPVGVPGELFIGGLGLARGYLGRPALTAEKFVPDPHSGEPGARLYRTGDRVRWRADGTLEFMGRVDQQVKIRGFRIEPGEVEHALGTHPQVREAVVVVREDAPGDRRLVGYVVAEDGEAAPSAAELRRHLKERLPDHMVPGSFVVLERLPLTPNGKVDRRALPAPEADRSGVEETYVAPRTPVEELLAGIWTEVLGLERVGVHDDFFALGGHSLMAMQVLARLRKTFRVELPLRALFEGPSVAELARRVEQIRRADAPVSAPLVPAERTGPLPLSFAQERLWFLDRLEGGSPFYNMPSVLRLVGPLDPGALERALGELVRRHEALRTTFREAAGGVPEQVVAPFEGFALQVQDLSGLPPEAREAEVRRWAWEEGSAVFDLSAGPLFRAGLVRVDQAEHVLLVCMHHIVSDGWSMGVLFRELTALYSAFSRGEPSPLPDLPIQYADYALWQRTWLQGEVLERQLGWWRERLAGAPALLELPTDRPHPAVQSHRGAHETVELPTALAERLEALGRGEGATLFMVLQAAFQVLLSKYSGSEDVVVGSPIAGRTRAEVEGLIGFFVNTLVLRTDLSGDPGFRDVLSRVREATLGAYEHQDVPFERLVEELRVERSLSRNPLFQVMLALQETHFTRSATGDLAWESMAVEHPVARFDLTLFARRSEHGLLLILNYATDLFDAATIHRMLGHCARLLEQAADAPERRLSQLDLLGDAERRRVLVEWNATAAPLPQACVHELFAAQARRTPSAVAVSFEAERVTYAELDARASQLAHHLRARGVGPEVRVGVLLERGPELIVSLLAVLKAGGAYVPLDPRYPAERLSYMLADSGVRLLLTHTSLSASVPESAAEPVWLDAEREEIAAADTRAPEVEVSPENLAYVIYTSGSTGRPKGVAVTHRAIVRLLFGTDYVHFGADEVLSEIAPVSFDASTFEVWGALLHGGRLAVFPPYTPSVAELEVFFREAGVTTAWMPTGLFHAVVDEHPTAFAPLRQVISGGEVTSPTHVRRVVERYPALRFVHAYGPTESTTYTTCRDVTLDDLAGGPISLGGPIGNTRLYVLDAFFGAMPVGVPGELFIGGLGLARGYLGRPALTAERFVPDPHSGEPGARLYRTGDRVRWRADGSLEFMGRVDQQVKVRGFRIEPGEVEHALATHPHVCEAVVVVREDAPGDRRLVGYVVAEDGEAAPSAAELRRHLKERLPDHMVPGAFVVVERLPLTPNGKVDRRALPAPEGDRSGVEEAYVAPRTPVEELLAGIWTEVLGLERVGVHDDFFALGGHSLMAMQVLARLRKTFRVELPLRALFEGPSVAELAARVEQIRRADAPVSAPLVPAERTGPLPLSFAQERLWFLDRLEGGSPFYNMPSVLRLVGPLDPGALERALGELVRRHEALRTTFREAAGGVPEQVVAPFEGFALQVQDLSGLPPVERTEEVGRWAREEGSAVFDLSAGPLFRAGLVRLDEAEHVLLVCMHHIVSDGWSMGVLFRELTALYSAFSRGEPSPLQDLPIQYADYALWQREHLQGEVLERQLGWWREQLTGAPALLELPTDRPHPAVQSHRGAHETVELPTALAERLEALGRGEGATLFMVLQAAFQVLLSKYSGSEDVVVGSPIAGRTRAEVEGLIGFFVNTLVLRTDLSGDPGFRDVLSRVREATLGAYEHQDVPFERLVEELRVERSLSRNPLFQVMLALQETHFTGSTTGDLSWESMAVEHPVARFDLTLFARRSEHGLLLILNYATDLFDAATIRRMLGHCARLLEQAADAPERRLSQLDLLGEAERRQVLVEWNATAAAYPADRSLHELFQAQVERSPHAVAVVFEGRTLTYLELNERANRLAHHLRRRGVGPEARVGLCLERGPELVVSLLAVLKAGGAYVPLDPAYPAERLGYMLQDSRAALVLTQAHLRDRLAGAAGDAVVVSVEDTAAALAGESTDDPVSGCEPGNLAYVMYTSGSTGRPKGVAVQHRSVVNLLFGTDYAHFGPDEVVLQLVPVSFDPSSFEIWGALLHGGRLAVFPPYTPSVAELEDFLREAGVTTAWLTSGVFHAVVNERPGALAPLRQLLAGGDVLSPAHVRRVVERYPALRMMNGYGPTETTTFTTCHRVTLDDLAGGSVPLGGPIGNTRLYVLDASLAPVPIGVPGELYIGGDGLARGYLGRPALTAEKFVPDPLSGEPGARLYRVGDRVRWLAGGTLEFLGRIDQQVKIRGFRIELGEVEHALAAHPRVREAVAVAREDAGDRRLVGYVVAKEGHAAPSAAELRRHLKERLPEHMVPGAFVFLERLPLTPNGKVDRRALPAPEADRSGADESYVAPRTPAEELLAGIWTEVLGLERVGVHHDFFALGGHSLLAMRVLARLREAFRVELPLRALFEAPSVAELAARVEQIRRADAPDPLPLVRVERTGALPLSLAQERLWFLDRLEGGSPSYNMPSVLRMTGPLDPAALERALGEIVRRHEALRTTFRDAGGVPEQVIAPFQGFALRVEDLSGLPPQAREDKVRRWEREEGGAVFDLSAGPLFRVTLLRLGQADHRLLVCMHHIVSDGWSMQVFSRELSRLYAAFARGEPSPLPELPIQYADYAVWQRAWLRGEVLERQLGYWRERLEGAPALLELPTDRPRPAVQSHRGAFQAVELPAELVERLKALGRGEGATLFMVLLAAFQVLLSRYSGSEDVVVGSHTAGRTRAEVEGLIGFFINTLVLRTDLSGDPGFRGLLGRVREVTLGAYDHQDVPFDRLVAELQPEREPSRNPLVQVMVNVLNLDLPSYSLGDVQVRDSSGSAPAFSKFDWTLYGAEREGIVRLTLGYNTDVFSDARAREVLRQLARLLHDVAMDPLAPISSLSLVSPEAADVLPDPARPLEAFEPKESIPARVRRIARADPDRVALRDPRGAWSYGALDSAAAAIAAALNAGGVAAGDTVAVYAHRGAALAAAILGVMRSGAAFALLDPAHPPERLLAMLRQTGASGWIRIAAAGPVPDALNDHVARTPVRCALDLPATPEAIEAAFGAAAPDGAGVGPHPDAPAYVLFTSGTSGPPRGIVGTHRPLIHFLDWHARTFGLDGADRFSMLSGLAHDPVLRDLLAPLWVGATLCIPDPDHDREPGWLRAWMRREGITVAHLTPSMGRLLLGAGPGDAGELPLRHAFFAGEALTRGDVARMKRAAPLATCVNFYGTTETPQAMGYFVAGTDGDDGDGDPLAEGEVVPVGRGIDGVQLLVLNARGQLAGIGELGEIHVRTPHLTRGYLDDPDLTGQRFLTNPFTGRAGDRVYRTGDYGRYLQDGAVAYAGRVDDQVKIRGYRIEPGEVEHALRAYPQVREAVVVVREDTPGDRRLVAYLVAEGEAAPPTAELRRHLKERLPDYMVPAAFMRIERLPLTSNGKVDRRALPAPDAGRPELEQAYVAPRTPTEEVLTEIWAEVLGTGQVGVHDDFFELGGHSLLAMQVVARVWDALQVDLPLHIPLFEAPTIAELAARVEEEHRQAAGSPPPPVRGALAG